MTTTATNPGPADAFRSELRAWLAVNVTPEIRNAAKGMAEPEDVLALRDWNAKLADAGWAAPAWPSEYGGRDADVDEQVAYLEVMHEYGAPGPVNMIGVSNIAPAIMAFGTEEQKAQFIGPMLRGDVIWSQGMSEPEAGSDLASLRCTAVADGDHFVINGQKTWNSMGHYADFCQLYVRTDPTAPKHKGISCLLVDLRTPGIDARPITTISGGHDFAELFITDARVPRRALLGGLGEGWMVAMTTLSFERAGVARLHLMVNQKLDDLRAHPIARARLAQDPIARQEFTKLHSEVAAMRWFVERSFANPGQLGGAGGSLTKLTWSITEQRIASLAVHLLGVDGLSGRWADNLLNVRSLTIAGGTTEVNRNIVGEHILGLPREPRPKT